MIGAGFVVRAGAVAGAMTWGEVGDGAGVATGDEVCAFAEAKNDNAAYIANVQKCFIISPK